MQASSGDNTHKTLFRLVVMFLGCIAFLAIIATVVLSLANKPTPEALTNLAFSAVGGLAGIVSTARLDDEDRHYSMEAIGEAATKSVLDEFVKHRPGNPSSSPDSRT